MKKANDVYTKNYETLLKGVTKKPNKWKDFRTIKQIIEFLYTPHSVSLIIKILSYISYNE